MGRPKLFGARLTLPLSPEVVAAIDAVLAPDEPRLALIREAIDREVKRRAKRKEVG